MHTPGPWKADRFCVWGGVHGQTYVAGTQTGLYTEDQQANALLIAAAPEMLAALKILTRPDKQLERTELGYSIFRVNDRDLEQIAQAIAKAEGRS